MRTNRVEPPKKLANESFCLHTADSLRERHAECREAHEAAADFFFTIYLCHVIRAWPMPTTRAHHTDKRILNYFHGVGDKDSLKMKDAVLKAKYIEGWLEYISGETYEGVQLIIGFRTSKKETFASLSISFESSSGMSREHTWLDDAANTASSEKLAVSDAARDSRSPDGD